MTDDSELKKRARKHQHRDRNLLHKNGAEIIVGSADPEHGAPGGTVPARVEDLSKLKGRWLRNTRSDTYCVIVDVGREGVLVKDCEGPFLPGYGETYGITWRAVKAIYNIQVSAHEVAGAK